jgi:hypothetical protein
MDSTMFNELDPIPDDEKRQRMNYAEVKLV